MLSQELLKKLFIYDPLIGIFIRRINVKGAAKGSKSGCVDGKGYLRVMISGKTYQAHRLVWLYCHGYFPEHQIDHINRIKSDNRLANLREVSSFCNIRNRSMFKNNKSGVNGVHFDNKKGKWIASIRVNYKRIFLGCHQDFDEAVCHRLAAEQAENWSGCDSSSPAYKYVKNKAQKP